MCVVDHFGKNAQGKCTTKGTVHSQKARLIWIKNITFQIVTEDINFDGTKA